MRCRNDDEAKRRAMRWFQKQCKRLLTRHGVCIEELDSDWRSESHYYWLKRFDVRGEGIRKEEDGREHPGGRLWLSHFHPTTSSDRYFLRLWLKEGDAINFDIRRDE